MHVRTHKLFPGDPLQQPGAELSGNTIQLQARWGVGDPLLRRYRLAEFGVGGSQPTPWTLQLHALELDRTVEEGETTALSVDAIRSDPDVRYAAVVQALVEWSDRTAGNLNAGGELVCDFGARVTLQIPPTRRVSVNVLAPERSRKVGSATALLEPGRNLKEILVSASGAAHSTGSQVRRARMTQTVELGAGARTQVTVPRGATHVTCFQSPLTIGGGSPAGLRPLQLGHLPAGGVAEPIAEFSVGVRTVLSGFAVALDTGAAADATRVAFVYELEF